MVSPLLGDGSSGTVTYELFVKVADPASVCDPLSASSSAVVFPMSTVFSPEILDSCFVNNGTLKLGPTSPGSASASFPGGASTRSAEVK